MNIENIINDEIMSNNKVITTPTTWLLSLGVAFLAGTCCTAKKIEFRYDRNSDILARLEEVEKNS